MINKNTGQFHINPFTLENINAIGTITQATLTVNCNGYLRQERGGGQTAMVAMFVRERGEGVVARLGEIGARWGLFGPSWVGPTITE